MEVATLVLSVVGLMLAVVSLVWQFVTFRRSGRMVDVVLHVGVMREEGHPVLRVADSGDPEVFAPGLETSGICVMAIQVRNIGRMEVTVRRWGFTWQGSRILGPFTGGYTVGPPLKHTIAAGDEATWSAPLEYITEAAETTGRVVLPGQAFRLRGAVELADGSTRSSANSALVMSRLPRLPAAPQ